MPKFKFSESDGFAVIPVQIKTQKATVSEFVRRADFKVDTGASSSTISIEALRGFGYDDNWVRENGRELTGNKRPLGFSGEYVDGIYEIHLPHVKIGLNKLP